MIRVRSRERRSKCLVFIMEMDDDSPCILSLLISYSNAQTRSNTHTRKSTCPAERRGSDRKDFSCYIQIINHDTQELVGHLTDISSNGFKLDSLSPITPNHDFRFRMNLSREVALKPSMIFVSCSMWC